MTNREWLSRMPYQKQEEIQVVQIIGLGGGINSLADILNKYQTWLNEDADKQKGGGEE